MKRRSNEPYTFDRVVRILISVTFICLGIFLIYTLKGVLLPFLIAWLIAYLLNPIVRFIQTRLHLKKRILAVLLTFGFLVGIVSLIIIGITPMVKKEMAQINHLVANYEIQAMRIGNVQINIHDFLSKNIDFVSLQEKLSKESVKEILEYIVPAVGNVLSGSISFILGFTVVFIVLLYLVFILLDYDKINQLWRGFIPHKHRALVNKLSIDVEKSMNNYFRHQALICLIVGTLFAIGFQLVGLPLALLLGVLIGFLHMIPYMHLLSIPPAILLCWLKVSQTGDSFWGLLLIIFSIYIIIQCIIDIILTPRIMGKAMGLNPAIILLSLSIWGSLMGIVGMIIAIPMTTLLLSYYQNFIDSKTDEEIEKLTEEEDKEILEG